MDKFANEDERHRDAEEYVTVQACIDDSKDRDLFVIATVNDKYCLPDSLIRAGRFDKLIEMRPPNNKDSEKIIRFFLEDKKVADDIDPNEISRILEKRTCAEFQTVINEAGIYAGYEGRAQIEKDDLIRACMRMLFGAPEIIDFKEESWKKVIAVHEAGHAVIRELLDPGCVSLVSVKSYSGDIGGVTITHWPDGFYYSKDLMENEIIGSLGGKAATEIILGRIDVGCNSDLHTAFARVNDFIENCCTNGFETFSDVNCASSYLLEKRDRLVASEMERYYQQAKGLIAGNRRFFDEMVDALMEKNTLTYKDIQNIREKYITYA